MYLQLYSYTSSIILVKIFRAVAKTRCTLLEYGQSKVQGRNEYN